MRASKRAGFTLIEIGVVLIFMVLLTMTVMPRLVSFQKGQQFREFQSRMKSLLQESRERAVTSKQKITIRIESGQDQVVSTIAGDDGTDQTLQSVSFVDGVTVSKVTKLGVEDSSETWSCSFYPDGSSEEAGIEFSSEGLNFSYRVEQTSGRVIFTNEVLPEMTTDEWEAGEREQRAG